MARRALDHRHETVLAVVVEQHVMTAQPVSSAVVARRSSLRLSPATVRYLMADLESEGYLRQKHPSGGRIPTDLGYRLYVDKLMRVRGLTTGERKLIMSEMRASCRHIDEVLRGACRVLSRIWGQLALALGPSITDGVLRRIELVPVASDRVLVVLSVASGMIRTVLVDTTHNVTPAKLEAASRVLNERLCGLPLADALQVMRIEPEAFSQEDPAVRQVLVRLADRQSLSKLGGELYVDGTSRVLDQPEFGSTGMVGAFLRVVEARDVISRELALLRHHTDPVVVIGRENSVNELRECSMVAAGYRVGRASGAVAILGPIRMPYSTLMPAVQFVAKAVSELMAGEGRA